MIYASIQLLNKIFLGTFQANFFLEFTFKLVRLFDEKLKRNNYLYSSKHDRNIKTKMFGCSLTDHLFCSLGIIRLGRLEWTQKKKLVLKSFFNLTII